MVANLRLTQVKYNLLAGQYQSEFGGFLAHSDIPTLIAGEKTRLEARLERIAERAIRGELSRSEFERVFSLELKTPSVRVGLLGFGGEEWLSMQTPQDRSRFYGKMSGELRRTYRRVSGFSEAMSNGQLSESQIRARARSYARGITRYFSVGEVTSRQYAGVIIGIRDLDPLAQHCIRCPLHSTNGRYVPIEEITPIGVDCPCGGNCRCRITFGTPDPSILNQKGVFSRLSLLNR